MMERVNTTTKTLERPDLREDTSSSTDDGTPKFFHYVKKDQIVDSAISGKMVVALCGVLLIVDGYDVFVAGTAGTEPETVYLMFSPAYTRESSTVFSPVTCWFFGYTWTSRFHPVTT